jgi:hypothetical protein
MVIIWTSTDNLLILIKVTSPMQLWGRRGHDRIGSWIYNYPFEKFVKCFTDISDF